MFIIKMLYKFLSYSAQTSGETIFLKILLLSKIFKTVYLYRIGHLSESIKTYNKLKIKYKFLKPLVERSKQMLNDFSLRTDIDQKLPADSKRPKFNNKILFLLNSSLPFDSAGYDIRSHHILRRLSDNLSLKIFTRLNYPNDMVRFDSRYSKNYNNNIDGINYERLDSNVNWSKVSDIEYFKEYASVILKKIKHSGFGVVHSNSNFVNGIVASMVSNETGGSSIYEMRGLWHYSRSIKEPAFKGSDHYKYNDRMEILAAKNVDKVVAISGSLVEWLVKNGVERNKVHLIPNGVDTEYFKPEPINTELRNKIGIDKNTIVVGYAGSLTKYEGIETIIEAVEIAAAKGLDIVFLILGKGYHEKKLRKFAHLCSRSSKSKSIFLGFVNQDEIKLYYSLFDIMPFPRIESDVSKIVGPLKILEAMAMKKTVVVSNHKPLTELIDGGHSGIIMEDNIPETLVNIFSEFAKEKDYFKVIGENAHKWVIENRSWNKIAESYMKIYSEL
jgi:glycosyltransferase involved in cell wall biosynthesis